MSPADAAEATRGSAIKLGAEVLGRALSLVTALLLARGLGVSGFGVFAAVSGIAALTAELANLGLQALAPQALVAGTVSLARLLDTKARLTAVVIAVTLATVGPFPLFACLLLYYMLAGWSEFLGVALRARGRRMDEAATILCQRATALASVLATSGLSPTPIRAAAALAGATAAPLILAAILLRRTSAPPAESPDFGSVLRLSFPLGVNGGLALLSLRLEVLALKLFRGDAEAGVFAVALRVVESLILVPSAVSAGAMPALTREALRGERGDVRARTALIAALLGAPSALGLAVVAPRVVTLFFGEAFAAAATPLRVLALALAAVFLNAVSMHALIATGRTSWLPRLTAVRVAAAAVLGLALIPSRGALGAAVGFLAAELLMLVLAARACAAARFGVPLARPLALGLGLSVPMALIVSAFLSRGGPVTSVVLGVVTYAATLFLAWRVAPGLFQSATAGGVRP